MKLRRISVLSGATLAVLWLLFSFGLFSSGERNVIIQGPKANMLSDHGSTVKPVALADTKNVPDSEGRDAGAKDPIRVEVTDSRPQSNDCDRSAGFQKLFSIRSDRLRSLTPGKVMQRALGIPCKRASLYPEIYQEIDKELRQAKAEILVNMTKATTVLQNVALALSQQGISSPKRPPAAGPYRVVFQRNKYGGFTYYIYHSDCPELVSLEQKSDCCAVRFSNFVNSNVPRWQDMINKEKED